MLFMYFYYYFGMSLCLQDKLIDHYSKMLDESAGHLALATSGSVSSVPVQPPVQMSMSYQVDTYIQSTELLAFSTSD